MIPQVLKNIRQKEGGNDFSSQFDHAGAYGSHMIAHALKVFLKIEIAAGAK